MKLEGPVLGYDKVDKHIYKQIIQPAGFVYTAAFIHCCSCGTVISGHGGPRSKALCVPCYTTLVPDHNDI